MKAHHSSCPRVQFWDANDYEAPCLCPPDSRLQRKRKAQDRSNAVRAEKRKTVKVARKAKAV